MVTENLVWQDVVGACAFLDVAEEAALRRVPVTVQPVEGPPFTDVVTDVVTREGVNRVVFRDRGELPAHAIAAMQRAGVPPR